MNVIDKTLTLLGAVSQALAEGVVHTNKQGERLGTVDAVLRCIRDEGEVTLTSQSSDLGDEGQTIRTAYGIPSLGEPAVHIKGSPDAS